MARYQKTLNLWDADIIEAILVGAIIVNRGQFVQCGDGVKSRLVGVNFDSGTFHCVHGGTYHEVNKKFSDVVGLLKVRNKLK